MSSPSIAVVIPALDEEKALPETLDSLLTQSGWTEGWIVDGGSNDHTCDIAREYVRRDSRLKVISAARGRARQMNAGARRSTADVLLFLHADTRLGTDSLAVLKQHAARGLRAGCFTVAFSPGGFLLRVLSLVHNWRFTLTRIAYGDQAFFVRRDLFENLGGFPEEPLEDIRLGERLRWTVRQRRLSPRVFTDSRKFHELGTCHAVACVLHILLQDFTGRLPRSRFLDKVR
ncbi:glycosyltransferase [Proteobacteria bacterium 005FR1]|nr:glycosyltransferase [Proteobacteria bacterium 005FR1]